MMPSLLVLHSSKLSAMHHALRQTVNFVVLCCINHPNVASNESTSFKNHSYPGNLNGTEQSWE